MILPVFDSRIPVTATHLNAYEAAPRLLSYFSNVIEREYSRPQWCAIHPRGSMARYWLLVFQLFLKFDTAVASVVFSLKLSVFDLSKFTF